MAKEILFDPELGKEIKDGSALVRHTVEANFGPLGQNTIRDQKYDLPLIANTGRRVLQELDLEDRKKNIAAVLVRDAALKVAETCGDGSIATAFLTDALIDAGAKLIAAGYNPMGLRRGMQKAMPSMLAALKEIRIPLEEISMKDFAYAVSKNEEVSENVVKAIGTVGADGVITVLDSQAPETTLHLYDGVRYDYGLFSAAFIRDPVHKCTELTEPYVLLSNVKISTVQDVRKILEDTLRTGSSLLMIVNDMTEEVQNLITANIARAGLKVTVAKAPGFGDTRRRNMLALAVKTGSLLIDENRGIELKDCGLEICAKVGHARIDMENTVLTDFQRTQEKGVAVLKKHTESLLEGTTDPDEREKLELTMSILNGKTAEIQAGAVVEYEMFEKKYLYENTVRAVQNAARSGLVPGAGSWYLYLADKAEAYASSLAEEERQGAQCLADALRELARRLFMNAGLDGSVVLEKVREEKDPWRGYDLLTDSIVDLKASGILEPENTAEMILSVAASTAGSLWTTNAAVIEKEEEKSEEE